ncbi:flippase-like domain-containing protein [Coralloluteibacterium stylophorae]|uniref:Flippase-like domain-containing protein n=1 Tax=Coralloluteibacterium stylophorae TaxID=1776034 RepID=A0AAP2FXD6_9GAMM|nr:flippase-like domain-containing protein [Coralloluteibacterium stylophorae]
MSPDAPPPRPSSLRAWRLVLPAGLLVLALAFADPGRAWAALAGADPGWLLAALLAVQAQVVLSAQRWRFTARRLGQAMPRRTAIAEYYLATLLNQSVPGGVGGDAVRAWRSGRARPGRMRAAVRAVVLERLAGQVALLTVVAIGLAAWPLAAGGAPPRVALWTAMAVAAALAAGAATVALLARRGPRRLQAALHGLRGDVVRTWFAGRAWLWQGAGSLAIVGGYIAAFALCACAVGTPLPPMAWLTAVPLALLAMLVPVSVGGWGVREAAAAALWPLVGLPAAHGVAASILYGLVNLVGALPGLAVAFSPARAADAAGGCDAATARRPGRSSTAPPVPPPPGTGSPGARTTATAVRTAPRPAPRTRPCAAARAAAARPATARSAPPR